MQNFVFFKIERTHVKVRFSEILYVQAERKYVTVVTHNQSFLALSSMNQIEKKLPVELFCRIHRSYIVGLEQICHFDHELVYIGTKKIPIADQYRNTLKNSVVIINGDVENHLKKRNSNFDL